MDDRPQSRGELDVRCILDLSNVEVGDELWANASMMYGDRFRAVKIEVKDRVSVNNFEEHHAIDKWPRKDRMKTNHEIAEGF